MDIFLNIKCEGLLTCCPRSLGFYQPICEVHFLSLAHKLHLYFDSGLRIQFPDVFLNLLEIGCVMKHAGINANV